MKKISLFLVFCILVMAVTGCGKSNSAGEDAEPTTMGTKLAKTFSDSIDQGKDMGKTMELLIEQSGFDCGTMECEEGFLNGFSGEITGFSSATMFAPFIGSIPFVGYVFVTDDTSALKDKLAAQADPRWNICTEAEETVIEEKGNYVFFVMCPGEDF